MELVHTIADDTITLIETAVREDLQGFNIQPCNIFPYISASGDEGISVGICYDDASKRIDPHLILKLVERIRDELVSSGEYRTPFVRHYFQPEQVVEGVACAVA